MTDRRVTDALLLMWFAQASWCTSLLVKCKKTKKVFMLTTRPGARANLKAVAKQVGAKELRMAGEKEKALLGLAEGCEGGCVTAMSVLGDTEGKVTSVVDAAIPEMAANLRMCSGCRDFKAHNQVTNQPPRACFLLRHNDFSFDATTQLIMSCVY